MKKWIIGSLVLVLSLYLLRPQILHLFGIYTTTILVYNGNDEVVNCQLNGKTIELQAGQAQVFRSSRFSNHAVLDQGNDHFEATFGPGQHFLNLGDARLRLIEQYYPWDEATNSFKTQARVPKDLLLYDAVLGKGLHTLDNCWDCCLLLRPNERPYSYLKPENKGKRILISSRM